MHIRGAGPHKTVRILCVCVCVYVYIYIYIYICVCVCVGKPPGRHMRINRTGQELFKL